MMIVLNYRAQGAALKIWEQIFHIWEICEGFKQPVSFNRWLLGTVWCEHHCATWDENNTNLLQRQCACHKFFKSSLAQSKRARGKTTRRHFDLARSITFDKSLWSKWGKTWSFKRWAQPHDPLINTHCWMQALHCRGLKVCLFVLFYFLFITSYV